MSHHPSSQAHPYTTVFMFHSVRSQVRTLAPSLPSSPSLFSLFASFAVRPAVSFFRNGIGRTMELTGDGKECAVAGSK